MKKIYTAQVKQFREGLINQIKTTFVNPEGDGIDIEFNHEFLIWRNEEDMLCDDTIQVLYHINGLRMEDGRCYLTGTTANFDDFDDLELGSIYNLYDIAYILDSITEGQYKIINDANTTTP